MTLRVLCPPLVLAIVLFGLAGLVPPSGEALTDASREIHATPTPLWAGLLDQEPVPVAAPLPPPAPTSLDGAYARRISAPPQWWSCLRCADYRPSGGTWRILLDRGILRIVYDATGWRTLASYLVDGDQVRVFNDPICPWEEGLYRLSRQAGGIRLQAIQDACAFGLRAENLTTGVWQDCRPPDLRSAVSEAWPSPAGCATAGVSSGLRSTSPTSVTAIPGDARREPSRLGWMAAANADNVPPPDGLEIGRAPAAVTYGLNVILWEGGAWIELTTEEDADAIGVQFWGPSSMGAARVLLDGTEIWRGEVSGLGRRLTMYGGYLEATDLLPGGHTLRVEHLGLDDRPVTVLFFGGR